MAEVVIIPFNYETRPEAERGRLIPICIPANDPRGFPIPTDWFERGVAPVHAQLVKIAEWRLGDCWCASELAELTIYNLFRRHGSNLGEYPWRRVLREAFWVARDLEAGGSRTERKRRAAETSMSDIEGALIDPTDYADRYLRELLLNAIETKLAREGRVEMREVFGLVRLGHTWTEIAEHFGLSSAEVLKRRFYRWAQSIPRRADSAA